MFETYFPKQTSNIKSCIQLSVRQKNEFFEAMKGLPNERETIQRAAENYFREPGRKLCGELVDIPEKTGRLGRLHQWQRIEHLLDKSRKNADFTPTVSPSVTGLRGRFLTGDPAMQKNVLEEILEYLRYANIPCPCIIWGFLFQDRDRPFSEENLMTLPCRLGLESIDHKEYLPFEIEISPGMEARKPTGFDAELDEYWCPGGMTRPRDECSDKDGLDEVVIGGFSENTAPNGLKLWDVAKAPLFRNLALVK